MKHEGYTPGPWKAARVVVMSGSCHAFVQANGGKTPIARADVIGDESSRGEARCAANARLIADAPRLYEENQRLREALRNIVAMERAMSDIPLTYHEERAVKIAREALGDDA